MKNLHIIINDKFDPSHIFEATNSDNEYICELKYEGDSIQFLDKNIVKGLHLQDIKQIVQLGNYDNIFFHSLPVRWYQLVQVVPHNKRVIWCLFGFELYENPYFAKRIQRMMSIYQPMTYLWYQSQNGHDDANNLSYREFFKEKLRFLKKKLLFYRIMNRIDYVAPIYTNELEILRKIKGFRAKFFPFQYSRWSINDEFEWKLFFPGKYILIGNSASPLNNHMEVIHLLLERGITDTLYLPLAYGDNNYIGMLKNYLDSNSVRYVTQESMLPYPEYKKNMLECSCVVIGSIRQHASDTIYMNILQGAKVFLYKKSIAYQYLVSVGIKVFSIENDLTCNSIKEDLSYDIKLYNRQKVLELVSKERIIEQVQNILETWKNIDIKDKTSQSSYVK